MISKKSDALFNTHKAFKTLDQLWQRDRVPLCLERHYFLFWFAFHGGDLDRTAQTLQVHRNTVQFHFTRFGLMEKADELGQAWGLLEKSKKAFFESNFLKFYHANEAETRLSAGENKVLIALWQAGFSFQTISAHYMLWALRNQRSKEWIRKRTGYTSHHCMRVLVSALDPRTANGQWLAPLKPRPDEIYSRGPRNRLMRSQMVERQMAVSK